MSKLSIKSSRIPRYAKIVNGLAYALCEALGVRGVRGEYSPTRLFYLILFAFQNSPMKTIDLLMQVIELGQPGLDDYYRSLNARRGMYGRKDDASE